MLRKIAIQPFRNVIAALRRRSSKRQRALFPGSEKYWEQRYASGGHSGIGSRGKFAEFKADFLNGFVAEHGITSVIEFGCGDGGQLALATYPAYTGLDLSETAVALCRERFRSDDSKSFKLMHEYAGERADLSLSLDVVYHLVEDCLFEEYMHTLFGAARKYVIIYSSNQNQPKRYKGTYIKHRRFTDWIEERQPVWELTGHVPNRYPYSGDYRTGSWSEFYVYRRIRA